MKLDGTAVHYLLAQEFQDVEGRLLTRTALYDYPTLYDESADMRGLVVLAPDFERPHAGLQLENALVVCLGEESAQSAWDAGISAVLIRDDASFQHVYNTMQRTFVHNERFDAQLRASVSMRAGFQSLLNACLSMMEYPCALIDEQFRLMCWTQGMDVAVGGSDEVAAVGGKGPAGADGDDGPVAMGGGTAPATPQTNLFEGDLVDMFMSSRGYRYMRANRNVFAMPGPHNLMMKNVFSQGRLVGSLVMPHRGNKLSARFVRFLLNYLSTFVSEMYGIIGSFGPSSFESSLVKGALEGVVAHRPAAYGALQAALVECGHEAHGAYVVARIDRSFTNDGSDESDYIAQRFELAWPHAYCFKDGAGLFMLVDTRRVPVGPWTDYREALPIVARDNLAKVGISRPFSHMADIDSALVQASDALAFGSDADPTNWCYRFDDYAFSWLVDKTVGADPIGASCHPAVVQLERFDGEHGTQLLDTLAAFMRCRYNASAAADELFVARSTLLNRLERIGALTGIDLGDFEERLYLGMSLAMANALAAENRPAGGR
ncbi:MAG TPA: hypothetical protein DCP91_13635 [Eggerthellaceae bacterium]|nr:hypothetical protein [Eggerthellaceae bacterium]